MIEVDKTSYGGNLNETGKSIKSLQNGGYVITGSALSAPGSQSANIYYSMWYWTKTYLLLKFSPLFSEGYYLILEAELLWYPTRKPIHSE